MSEISLVDQYTTVLQNMPHMTFMRVIVLIILFLILWISIPRLLDNIKINDLPLLELLVTAHSKERLVLILPKWHWRDIYDVALLS